MRLMSPPFGTPLHPSPLLFAPSAAFTSPPPPGAPPSQLPFVPPHFTAGQRALHLKELSDANRRVSPGAAVAFPGGSPLHLMSPERRRQQPLSPAPPSSLHPSSPPPSSPSPSSPPSPSSYLSPPPPRRGREERYEGRRRRWIRKEDEREGREREESEREGEGKIPFCAAFCLRLLCFVFFLRLAAFVGHF